MKKGKRFKQCLAGLAAALLMRTMAPLYAAPADFSVDLRAEHTAKAPRPQDDFYLSVNYDWLRQRKIPSDEMCIDMFKQCNDAMELALGQITTAATLDSQGNADLARISAIYACVQDDKGRKEAGYGELGELLERIEAVETPQQYVETLASIMGRYGIPCWFGSFGIMRDRIDGTDYITAWGLPVPGLGKEFMENPNNADEIAVYEKHIARLLEMYGRDKKTAADEAARMIDMQRDIVAVQKPLEVRQDPRNILRAKPEEIISLYKNIDLAKVLDAAGIGASDGVTEFDYSEPEAIRQADSRLTQENLPLLKDYAIVQLTGSFETVLTPAYREDYEAFSQKLTGARSYPAEKRNQRETESLLPLSYGRQYAAVAVNEQMKKDVTAMAEEMKAVYRAKLDGVEWMSHETKTYAKQKLDRMRIKAGAPEKWPEYLDTLTLKQPSEGGVLVNNVLEILQATVRYAREKLHKPYDAEEWQCTPQTVNAYYNPLGNEIMMPAAILQAPFYSAQSDRIENLGGIGMVLAHALSPSFDSSGAQFDADGLQRLWWTEQDWQAYQKQLDRIVTFYNRYDAGEGMRTNGAQTLTENIADLGGMSVITASAGEDTKDLRRLYEKTAICWRSKARDFMLRSMAVDTHSFPYVRINGTMSSTEGFYRAFDIKPGDGMYVGPEDRAYLW